MGLFGKKNKSVSDITEEIQDEEKKVKRLEHKESKIERKGVHEFKEIQKRLNELLKELNFETFRMFATINNSHTYKTIKLIHDILHDLEFKILNLKKYDKHIIKLSHKIIKDLAIIRDLDFEISEGSNLRVEVSKLNKEITQITSQEHKIIQDNNLLNHYIENMIQYIKGLRKFEYNTILIARGTNMPQDQEISKKVYAELKQLKNQVHISQNAFRDLYELERRVNQEIEDLKELS